MNNELEGVEDPIKLCSSNIKDFCFSCVYIISKVDLLEGQYHFSPPSTQVCRGLT